MDYCVKFKSVDSALWNLQYVLLALHEIYYWATLTRNTPLSLLRVAANLYIRLESVEYIRDPVASDLNVIPHTKSHGPHSQVNK